MMTTESKRKVGISKTTNSAKELSSNSPVDQNKITPLPLSMGVRIELLPFGYKNMKTARKIHTKMKKTANQNPNKAVFRFR